MTFRVRSKNRSGAPTILAALIRSAYPSREPDEVLAIRAFHGWRRAVSERTYRNARPVRFKEGTLTVHTATSAWCSELEFDKERLLRDLKKNAPEARVRTLRFRVGPLPDLNVGTRPLRPPVPPVVVATLPERLARTLASIDDDELREAINAAASVGLGRDAQR
ncbi:MAG TPA: DUF721 domain-containing protein [Polyangiales bacterium]